MEKATELESYLFDDTDVTRFRRRRVSPFGFFLAQRLGAPELRFGEAAYMSDTEIRIARDHELDAVALLASEVFDEFIARFYSPEGREEFHRYAATQALRERNRADPVTLIARKAEQVIGMLHLRQHRHVAMFFIHRAHQRDGVGRKLLNLAAELSFTRGCSPFHLSSRSGWRAKLPVENLVDLKGQMFILTGVARSFSSAGFPIPTSLASAHFL